MIETANEEMRMDQLARKLEEEKWRNLGEKFEFEPRFLSWCQRFTIAKLSPEMLTDLASNDLIPKEWTEDLPNGASPLLRSILNKILDGDEDPDALRAQFLKWNFDFAFDPARGEVRAVFALCDRLNSDGRCAHFSPREHKEAV